MGVSRRGPLKRGSCVRAKGKRWVLISERAPTAYSPQRIAYCLIFEYNDTTIPNRADIAIGISRILAIGGSEPQQGTTNSANVYEKDTLKVYDRVCDGNINGVGGVVIGQRIMSGCPQARYTLRLR